MPCFRIFQVSCASEKHKWVYSSLIHRFFFSLGDASYMMHKGPSPSFNCHLFYINFPFVLDLALSSFSFLSFSRFSAQHKCRNRSEVLVQLSTCNLVTKYYSKCHFSGNKINLTNRLTLWAQFWLYTYSDHANDVNIIKSIKNISTRFKASISLLTDTSQEEEQTCTLVFLYVLPQSLHYINSR